MKKIVFLSVLMIAFFLFSFSVEAAYFLFDNATINVSNQQTFEVKVNLNPEGDSVYSTDIYLNYDSSFLKVNSVSAGTLFPTVSNDISQQGKVYIAAMVNDPASSVSSSGTVATISFTALKDGATSLSFDCNNSKIIKNDANATNVLTCSKNNIASITIGAGNQDQTNQQINELPKTGFFDNVLRFGIPGIVLVVSGGLLKFFFLR